MTYRASVSTGELARQDLVAALEAWPRVHRSIFLLGERLSVDDTCPVIIHQSSDEEECEISSQPDAESQTVPLSTFWAAVISVLVIAAVLGSVAVVMIIVFTCTFRR